MSELNHTTNLLRLLQDGSQETQWFEQIKNQISMVADDDVEGRQDMQIQIIEMIGLRMQEVEVAQQKASAATADDGERVAGAVTKTMLVDLVKKLFEAQAFEYQILLNNLDESLLESCGILNSTHD